MDTHSLATCPHAAELHQLADTTSTTSSREHEALAAVEARRHRTEDIVGTCRTECGPNSPYAPQPVLRTAPADGATPEGLS